MSHEAIVAFVLAGWLLNLTPGPDVLCITTHALRGGLRAGAWAAIGVIAGCLVHVVIAGLGVGAMLSTSAWAFQLLKWLGSAYLVLLGLRMLWASRGSAQAGGTVSEAVGVAPAATASVRPLEAWRAGFLTNVLNPKVALFFLAFVPQFIPADAAHPVAMFLALGLLFNLNSLPINLAWAWLGARASRSPVVHRVQIGLDRLAGLLFVGFGVRLAWSSVPTNP